MVVTAITGIGNTRKCLKSPNFKESQNIIQSNVKTMHKLVGFNLESKPN